MTKSLLEHPTLQAQGSHITVLEARTLVSGATGRNGGHLVSAAGHTYSDLARRYGEENAKQITRFSIRNIDYILEMVRNMDEDLQNYSQIRDVIKVMVAGDKETWEHARASLVNFKDAVPEHHDYHRIVEEEDVADVSTSSTPASNSLRPPVNSLRMLTFCRDGMSKTLLERLSMKLGRSGLTDY